MSSSEKENSATEITTDSEFDHDDMTPTREIPFISLNDINVSKHRGNYQTPKKVQVKSGELQRPVNTQKSGNIELKMTQITSTPVTQKITSPDITNIKPSPLINPRKGDYNLNRTQSTGGIAAKISLELKKKYLLDTSALAGNIQKSGSTTALDSKLKSFHSNISEHQKLLNPAPEISPTMQAFLQGTSKIHQPLSPSITPKSPTFSVEPRFDSIIKENKEEKEGKTDQEKEVKILSSPEIIDSVLKPSDKFSMQPDITKDVLIEDMNQEKCDSPKLIDEYEPNIIYLDDTEGRPRSPVHETSIIVPEISWKELNKPEKKSETDIDTDSLSSENSDLNEQKSVNKVFSDIPRVEIHDSSGELLQDDDGDIMMDSLCIIPDKSQQEVESNRTPSILSEPPKSIQSEKKSLNQPKILPVIENGFDKMCHGAKETEVEDIKNSSGRSTPISISDPGGNDGTAAVLTETELSDWARDGAVSDDLDDVELDMNPEFTNSPAKKGSKIKSVPQQNAKIATGEDFEDSGNICGKDKSYEKPPNEIKVPMADFDSIEFMDTGSEISCDDVIQTSNTVVLKNRGFVQFVQEEEQQVVPQNVPNDNQIIEAVNENFNVPPDQNTGYCVFGNEDENSMDNLNGKGIDLKPTDLELNKFNCDTEEDSLLNVDGGTTTEENTCSDSTVKDVHKTETETLKEKLNLVIENLENNVSNKTEDEIQTPVIEERNNEEYDDHVRRMQLKYEEFGFVKDSIDVRKSKRKSKSQSPPDSHSESLSEHQSENQTVQFERNEPVKEIPVSPTFTSPVTSKKLDEINRERTKQKDLIHDLVMDKVKIQRRPLDKRRRIRDALSPSSSPVRTNFDLSKSATTASGLAENVSKNIPLPTGSYKSNEKSPVALQKSPTVIGIPVAAIEEKENSLNSERPHVVTSYSMDNDFTPKITPKKEVRLLRPFSVIETSTRSHQFTETPSFPENLLANPEAFSLPDVNQIGSLNEFKTPVAPPRTKHEEAKRAAEKLKQDAKVRARLMSDEDLGLSPEDRMNIYRQKLQRSAKKNSIDDCIQDSIESLVLNTEKRNALFNDTLAKQKQSDCSDLKPELYNSFSSNDISNKLSMYSENCDSMDPRNRTKSVSEIANTFNTSVNEEELKKSLSGNIIQRSDSQKRQLQFYKSDPNLLTENNKEKKSKDRERRKSIIKSVADFFQKKKDPKDSVKSPNTTSSGGVKERFSRFRISPKIKEKSKVSIVL